MIENLLHANVVLSKEQAKQVQLMCKRNDRTTKVPSDRKIAIISYLGVKPDRPLQLCFLVRFVKPYRGKDLVFAIREAFGFTHDQLYIDNPDEFRLLVWKRYEKEPKNPRGLIRSMARTLAREFTNQVSPFIE